MCCKGHCITKKKKDKPVLDATVTVRTSKDEKNRWLQQAADARLSISDWLRARITAPHEAAKAITGRRTPRRSALHRPNSHFVPVDPALLRALNAIGSNLNQVARHLNRGRTADASILHALVRMERSLERIAQSAWASKGGDDAS